MGSRKLIFPDIKLGADYSPEFLAAAARHIALYCCLPSTLPPPRA
jgi:hypothetical protein